MREQKSVLTDAGPLLPSTGGLENNPDCFSAHQLSRSVCPPRVTSIGFLLVVVLPGDAAAVASFGGLERW